MAWPAAYALVAQLEVPWLSQVRPMFECVCVCVCGVQAYFTSKSAGPWIHSSHAIFLPTIMQHDQRNFHYHLSVPCMHACNLIRALYPWS